VEYLPAHGIQSIPLRLELLSTTPCAVTSKGRNAFVTAMAPKTFVSKRAFASSVSVSARGPHSPLPALLTRTSRPLSFVADVTVLTAAAIDDEEVTSRDTSVTFDSCCSSGGALDGLRRPAKTV